MSELARGSSTWRRATLQDLVFFQRGFDITKSEQQSGDIPVVSSSGINSFHSEAMVGGPGVIIGRKGSLGTVHYVESPYWPHDTTLWSKDFKGNHPRFVYYYLHMMHFERYDVGNSNPTLNRNHIHKLDVLIPELPIQEKIASILSAYDDLIENNRRRIGLLEQAARLLYKEWFVHLRFPGHEHVGVVEGVPAGWRTERLRNITTKIGSGATPLGGESSYKTEGITLIRSQNVFDYTFVEDGLAFIDDEQAEKLSNVTVEPADILLNITGASVARCCMVPERHLPARVNQHVMIIRANPEHIGPHYLLYTINANQRKQYLLNIARSGGATREALTKEVVSELEIPIPEPRILDMFEETSKTIFAQIQVLDRENNRLAAARDLLLPRLMSGETVV
ncbi:restriction endonuclease subunit S [bacterium]|nr:restriction endonuclease subunit S [bacterium]